MRGRSNLLGAKSNLLGAKTCCNPIYYKHLFSLKDLKDTYRIYTPLRFASRGYMLGGYRSDINELNNNNYLGS